MKPMEIVAKTRQEGPRHRRQSGSNAWYSLFCFWVELTGFGKEFRTIAQHRLSGKQKASCVTSQFFSKVEVDFDGIALCLVVGSVDAFEVEFVQLDGVKEPTSSDAANGPDFPVHPSPSELMFSGRPVPLSIFGLDLAQSRPKNGHPPSTFYPKGLNKSQTHYLCPPFRRKQGKALGV